MRILIHHLGKIEKAKLYKTPDREDFLSIFGPVI